MFIHEILLKIRNNVVYTWNTLQDIRQNHWIMKYKLLWPTFILKSTFGSYWHNLKVHRLYTKYSSRYKVNHSVWIYRSMWPKFILGQTSGDIKGQSARMVSIHEIIFKKCKITGLWNIYLLWPTFILRPNVRSSRLIIEQYDIHTCNTR